MITERDEEGRLQARYAAMTDEALLTLALEPLQEPARHLLGLELRLRKLISPHRLPPALVDDDELIPKRVTHGQPHALWYQFPGDYACLAPQDCTWTFASQQDADLAEWRLSFAGIPSDMHTGPGHALDLRAPMVAVLPRDREIAAQLLSQPMSEVEQRQYDAEMNLPDEEEWCATVCPRCGTQNPVLLSAEPMNRWRCAGCDYVWQEEGLPEED